MISKTPLSHPTLAFLPQRSKLSEEQENQVPLSGEAIRTMNYVDDISVTLRRILAVLPSLTEEEKARVLSHIRQSEPSLAQVETALSAK